LFIYFLKPQAIDTNLPEYWRLYHGSFFLLPPTNVFLRCKQDKAGNVLKQIEHKPGIFPQDCNIWLFLPTNADGVS